MAELLELDLKEFWVEVMKIAQKKYRCATEVQRLTEEIADSLNRDDRVSTQLLLGMRQEEMEHWGEYNHMIEVLGHAYPKEIQRRMNSLLDTKKADEDASPEEKKVAEILANAKSVIDKTIQIDRVINIKIAGSKSYYTESQK